MSDEKINRQREIGLLCEGLHPSIEFAVTNCVASRDFMASTAEGLGVTIMDLTPSDLVDAMKSSCQS